MHSGFRNAVGAGGPNRQKYAGWLNAIPENEEIVNLFMDYETFGEHQWAETGIFDFLRALPHHILSATPYSFVTPSEAVAQLQPVAGISMPNPVSWADVERNLSAWLGNDIQDDAFGALYRLAQNVRLYGDHRLVQDWEYLQSSNHFYYMCTKYFADGNVHKYFNPYDSPYLAFINFMNVLSDFEQRVNTACANNAANEPFKLMASAQEENAHEKLQRKERRILN